MDRMVLRILVVTFLVLACGLSLWMGSMNLLSPSAAAGPAQEQTEPQPDPQTNSSNTFDCETFAYQEHAQLWYDRDHTDPFDLDADNDGIACEALPSRPTPPPGGEGGLTTSTPPGTTPPTTSPPTTTPPPPSTTTNSGGPERGRVPLLGGEDTSEATVEQYEETTEVAPPVKETLSPGPNNVGKPPSNIGSPREDVRGAGQEKVTVCHKGKKTLTLPEPAWAGHERHGDTKDSCPPDAGGGGSEGQEKVTVCHKGKTLTLPEPAVAAHLGHDDTPGAC
jgi:hypothetical protein